MAQVNITLTHEELIELLGGNRDEAFKHLVERILNEALRAESDEQLQAEQYERTDERTDYRNGTRERQLTTRIGTLTLEVPRHRNQPFHTMLFESYQKTEIALLVTMAEMVINGISTRKVSKVLETICGKSFSKSTVSEVCKRLDPEIHKFRNRRFEGMEYPFLMVDATYFKAMEDHKIVSKPLFIAVGFTPAGKREILYFNTYDAENDENWLDFFQHLRDSGLKQPLMLTSDAHVSIRNAAAKVFPGTPWQRCQFHFMKNILDAAPKAHRFGLEQELREMLHSETLKEARARKMSIISDYSDVAPKAIDILEAGFEDALTVHLLPKQMRVPLRTSNTIERINGELKRRSEVIRVFPNEASVLRLMGAVLLEQQDKLTAKRHLFSMSAFSSITQEDHIKLQKLALEQHNMLKAA